MSASDFTGIESQLEAATAAAKIAVSHAEEWKRDKAIKAGSSLAEELDAHLTAVLERVADEKAKDADRLTRQLERMRIADRQRQLQAEIAANEEKLRALN